jgi:hypothetical protein
MGHAIVWLAHYPQLKPLHIDRKEFAVYTSCAVQSSTFTGSPALAASSGMLTSVPKLATAARRFRSAENADDCNRAGRGGTTRTVQMALAGIGVTVRCDAVCGDGGTVLISVIVCGGRGACEADLWEEHQDPVQCLEQERVLLRFQELQPKVHKHGALQKLYLQCGN